MPITLPAVSRRRFLAASAAATAGLLTRHNAFGVESAVDPSRFALLSDTHIDADVAREVDAATDTAEASPACDGAEALTGVYADPAVMPTLWYRGDAARAVDAHERPTSWGTHDG